MNSLNALHMCVSFSLVSLDCSSSSEDMDFRMCWQPEHRFRILEVVFLLFITKVLSVTHGDHVLKLVTSCGVIHHSERESEPQSYHRYPWPVSVEAGSGEDSSRLVSESESGDPCTPADELHACCELKRAFLSALSSTWKFFLTRLFTE